MRGARVVERAEDAHTNNESAVREPPRMPEPALSPANLIALQPSVGNAALARLIAARGPVLARTKPEHVQDLQKWRANLQVLEDTVMALLHDEKRYNAMHEGYRYVRVDIAKLEKRIAEAKPLLADVEAEKDPDNALAMAIEAIKAGGAEKVNLESLYGGEDVRNVRKKLVGERAEAEEKEAKKKEKADYEAKRRQEEEDKGKQAEAAEQQRQTELGSLGIAPNAAGPAYTWSNQAAQRRNILRFIQLRHLSFAGLAENQIHDQHCFVYHLTLAQIERVERFLEGRTVTEFKRQGIPATRQDTGLHSPLVMPSKVSGVYPELGAEIFCDWAVERARHSSLISRIADSFAFTTDEHAFATWGTIDRPGNKIAYTYTSSQKKLVTNADRSAIITYYDGYR
jgi:hypothetical protein